MKTQVVKRMVELSKVKDLFSEHLGNCHEVLKWTRASKNKVMIAVVERDYELLESTINHVLEKLSLETE